MFRLNNLFLGCILLHYVVEYRDVVSLLYVWVIIIFGKPELDVRHCLFAQHIFLVSCSSKVEKSWMRTIYMNSIMFHTHKGLETQSNRNGKNKWNWYWISVSVSIKVKFTAFSLYFRLIATYQLNDQLWKHLWQSQLKKVRFMWNFRYFISTFFFFATYGQLFLLFCLWSIVKFAFFVVLENYWTFF